MQSNNFVVSGDLISCRCVHSSN